MPQRPYDGVHRAILTAAITSCLIFLTVIASQGTNTNLLSRLESEAAHTAQIHGAARLGGPVTDSAAHPLGPIARFTLPRPNRVIVPIGTTVQSRHFGDPPAGAITPRDSRYDRDRHDVEDGDRDDSHGHHHHHHHP